MRTLLLPLLGLSFSMQAAVAQYKHVPLSLSDATKMNIYVERTVEIGSKNVSKVVRRM